MSLEIENTLQFDSVSDYQMFCDALTVPAGQGNRRIDFEKLLPIPDTFGYPSEDACDALLEFVHHACLKPDIDIETWTLPLKSPFPEVVRRRIRFGHQVYLNNHRYGARTKEEWSLLNWGTKQNAQCTQLHSESLSLSFVTLDTAPFQYIRRVADIFVFTSFLWSYRDDQGVIQEAVQFRRATASPAVNGTPKSEKRMVKPFEAQRTPRGNL